MTGLGIEFFQQEGYGSFDDYFQRIGHLYGGEEATQIRSASTEISQKELLAAFPVRPTPEQKSHFLLENLPRHVFLQVPDVEFAKALALGIEQVGRLYAEQGPDRPMEVAQQLTSAINNLLARREIPLQLDAELNLVASNVASGGDKATVSGGSGTSRKEATSSLHTFASSNPNPSVFVTRAQRDENWSEPRGKEWDAEVLKCCVLLRFLGIDVDVDLFHIHELGIDWTRWGPQKIRDSNVVIIAASVAWRQRWEGRNTPTVGAGSTAEAAVLRSLFDENQQAFRDKLLLLVLPSMLDSDVIPDGLHGVPRFMVPDISPTGLEGLLRTLTTQPLNPLPPLGAIPVLPPTSESNVASFSSLASIGTTSQPQGRDAPMPSNLELRTTTPEQVVDNIPDPELEEERGPAAQSARSANRRPLTPSTATSDPRVTCRSERQLLDSALQTSGAPERWMAWEGVLLLRIVVMPNPDTRHPVTMKLPETMQLVSVSMHQDFVARFKPSAPLLFLKALSDWRSIQPRLWHAGGTSNNPTTLANHPTAAIAFYTRPASFTFDRTWPNKIPAQDGTAYYMAREPDIVVEMISALEIASSYYAPLNEVESVDVLVQIAAAPGGQTLASAEGYTPASNPFGPGHPRVRPTGPLGHSHYFETGRFSIKELCVTPDECARVLLADWLSAFQRRRDVFDDIRI